MQEVTDAGVREQPLAQAVIYRVNIEGKNQSTLDIPLEQTIHSRELLLLIRNEDSPPLAINGVRAGRREASLVFFAKEPGHYTLLTGNTECAAPRYDLPGLGADLNDAAAAELAPGPLVENPGYKIPRSARRAHLGRREYRPAAGGMEIPKATVQLTQRGRTANWNSIPKSSPIHPPIMGSPHRARRATATPIPFGHPVDLPQHSRERHSNHARSENTFALPMVAEAAAIRAAAHPAYMRIRVAAFQTRDAPVGGNHRRHGE